MKKFDVSRLEIISQKFINTCIEIEILQEQNKSIVNFQSCT